MIDNLTILNRYREGATRRRLCTFFETHYPTIHGQYPLLADSYNLLFVQTTFHLLPVYVSGRFVQIFEMPQTSIDKSGIGRPDHQCHVSGCQDGIWDVRTIM